MKLSSIAILVVTLAVNLLIWIGVNKPYHLIESSYPVGGLSLNPFKKHQSPFDGIWLLAEDLDQDIQVLAEKTRSIRLYSATGGFEQIPAIAKKYDLKVIAGAHLDARPEVNALELENAIAMTGRNRNISRLLIGNETQLHETVPPHELRSYLRGARKQLKTPVSTAEPWDFWILHPEFADEVDYLAIHILPYWAEIPIDKAVDYVFEKYITVKETFPNKMVMIAETGWPSNGPQRGRAEASLANQAQFVREFVRRAAVEKVSYNIIEAFDQPWKSRTEGQVGEHWGMMDADRHDKFPLSGPVLEDPTWKYWALSSSILGFFASVVFFIRRSKLKLRGQIFSIVIFQLAAAAATELAREASNQYMSPADIAFWTVMITAQVLLAIILLTDAVEIADVVGHKPLKHRFLPTDRKPNSYPFVSLHLPCCKEPPAMVIATLDSLAALDYPNFEVIVVDNNSPDSKLWKPVDAHCKALGERFRFYSLGKWPGFKAGALNYALRVTNPESKIIGVIDADYVVKENWLSATVSYFEDPEVAVVQAPQEHRDWEHKLFQRMENDEYSGFFRIGMVQRNEYNAIIQHGTMTLIDKATLVQLGGWAQWCICEDAELGLRILNAGKKAIYLNHPFGHGLVPDSYEAYAKQRFRWAYGAMRILRHHWRELLGVRGKLSRAQRYQFVKGWLPWIGDALHMVFTLTAILWSLKLILWPLYTAFPEPIFIYPALSLVILRFAGTIWTYAARVKIGKRRTLLAMIAGGSLTHKIAKAVFQGLFGKSQPFYRTPKMDRNTPVLKALANIVEELGLTITLFLLAAEILRIFGTVNSEAVLWAIALVVQTFPYIAAIAAALVSGYAARSKDDRNHRWHPLAAPQK